MKSVKTILKNRCDKYAWDTIWDHTIYNSRTIIYQVMNEPYLLARHMFLIQLSQIEDIK